MAFHQSSEIAPQSSEKQPLLPAAERIVRSPHYFRETALHSVLKSRTFAEKRSSGLPGVQAFSKAAASLAQSPEDIDDFDRSILLVTSQLGTYLDAQNELSTINEQRNDLRARDEPIDESLSERVKELKLTYLIPFNRSLKEMINDNPNLSVDALTKNLGVAYQGIYSHYNSLHPEQPPEEFSHIPLSDALYQIEFVINGMRHEIAAESLLTAAGVEYDYDVSEEQDYRGRDMFVKLGGKWIGIDVKSSLKNEIHAHQSRYTSRAVWTGLKPDDFNGVKDALPGSVSISFATAKEHADAFVERIESMASGELTERHRSLQSVGNFAVKSAIHSS
jgi:hypothetical protein